MDHKNCQVNININYKTYSIYYSYRSNSIFQDLLEYFAFLYPEFKICQCYCFRAGNCSEDLRILNYILIIMKVNVLIPKKINYFIQNYI